MVEVDPAIASLTAIPEDAAILTTATASAETTIPDG